MGRPRKTLPFLSLAFRLWYLLLLPAVLSFCLGWQSEMAACHDHMRAERARRIGIQEDIFVHRLRVLARNWTGVGEESVARHLVANGAKRVIMCTTTSFRSRTYRFTRYQVEAFFRWRGPKRGLVRIFTPDPLSADLGTSLNPWEEDYADVPLRRPAMYSPLIDPPAGNITAHGVFSADQAQP